MGTKKNIGQYIKERLSDFRESPDPGVWDSIISELDGTQKRKGLPLWLYGGAVIVGVGVFLWLLLPLNTTTVSEDSMTTTAVEQTDQETTKQLNKKRSTSNPTFIRQETESNETPSTSVAASKQRSTTKSYLTKKDKKSQRSKEEIETTTTSKNENLITSLQDFERLIATSKERRKQQNEQDKTAYKQKIDQEIEALITSQKEEAQRSIAEALIKRNDSLKAIEKETTLSSQEKKPKVNLPKSQAEREESRKAAIEYEVAVSPYTSLLQYGSLSKASSIDDRLVNNPRQAIPTTGYGVKVDYALTEKTSLRLGIGYAPLKYRTDNFQVAITNGNINIYELSAINLNDLNGQNTAASSPEALAFFNANSVVSIQQNISYIEVPIDFQYKFINKRLALSVSPGLSVLVLNNNEIFATADSGQSIFVGRETNLNGLSFAFNLGLGGHYNINDAWRLNVEPIFRYQLNPYANSVSNFRPYYSGVQFGMSYKF